MRIIATRADEPERHVRRGIEPRDTCAASVGVSGGADMTTAIVAAMIDSINPSQWGRQVCENGAARPACYYRLTGWLRPRVLARGRVALLRIPCRFRLGLSHSRLLHRGHIWISVCFGTQWCPQRKHFSVGIRILTTT